MRPLQVHHESHKSEHRSWLYRGRRSLSCWMSVQELSCGMPIQGLKTHSQQQLALPLPLKRQLRRVSSPLRVLLRLRSPRGPAAPRAAYTKGKLKSGDVLSAENVDIVKDVLDPGAYWQIKHDGRLVDLAPGLGCMGMSISYGPADEAESIATLHRAVELGCN